MVHLLETLLFRVRHQCCPISAEKKHSKRARLLSFNMALFKWLTTDNNVAYCSYKHLTKLLIVT